MLPRILLFFTVVNEDDAEHRVIVRIRGPLVDILVSIAPDVYGPYVSTNKSGQKVLIVECLNAVYGMMVAVLDSRRYPKYLTRLTLLLYRSGVAHFSML